jgi:hypothetical protein
MFDYSAGAELFPRRSGLKTRQKIGYQRFLRADAAILFAIEAMPPDLLNGAVLEVNEERFDADRIRQLYDDAEFPLPRKQGEPS